MLHHRVMTEYYISGSNKHVCVTPAQTDVMIRFQRVLPTVPSVPLHQTAVPPAVNVISRLFWKVTNAKVPFIYAHK